MSGVVSRRAFFRGRSTVKPKTFRPPWAVSTFESLCDGCGDCVPSCPEKILMKGSDGRPIVSFAETGCSFCGACARACSSGALAGALVGKTAPWSQRVEVTVGCLAANGVMCGSCVDPCGARALRMRPVVGGRALPVVDDARCTGCGACVGVCPVGALSMVSIPGNGLSPVKTEVATCVSVGS